MTKPAITTSLAASQKSNLCDEAGIVPAIKKAIRRGDLASYATAHDYLEDVLEGEIPDRITKFGWSPCRTEKQCARAGKCLKAGA